MVRRGRRPFQPAALATPPPALCDEAGELRGLAHAQRAPATRVGAVPSDPAPPLHCFSGQGMSAAPLVARAVGRQRPRRGFWVVMVVAGD